MKRTSASTTLLIVFRTTVPQSTIFIHHVNIRQVSVWKKIIRLSFDYKQTKGIKRAARTKKKNEGVQCQLRYSCCTRMRISINSYIRIYGFLYRTAFGTGVLCVYWHSLFCDGSFNVEWNEPNALLDWPFIECGPQMSTAILVQSFLHLFMDDQDELFPAVLDNTPPARLGHSRLDSENDQKPTFVSV